MPNLSLSNLLTTSRNRIPHIVIDEDFASGNGGWVNNSNATLDGTTGVLQVTATATNGYAYKVFAVTPYTTYSYSIRLHSANHPTAGHIKIGESIGGADYIDVDADTALTTYTGTFTIGAVPIIVLHLQTDGNAKVTQWDNILIQEKN